MSKINTANLKMTDKWMRLAYMILFVIINYFIRFIILGISLLQFLIVLFTNKRNDNLLKIGKSMSTFSYQILLFITFSSEEKPFPFGDWPKD